jgi:NAD(P)H-flavin reductase
MSYKQQQSLQRRTSIKKRDQREIIIVWGNKPKAQFPEVEEFARYRYHQCITLHKYKKNASD